MRRVNSFFRIAIMKNKTIDAAQVWKDFEDLLAPKLNFSVTDRAVYSHLLRHSRLVGKLRIRFSLSWLGPEFDSPRERLARPVGASLFCAYFASSNAIAKPLTSL